MTPEEKKARIEKTLFGDSLSADAMERELRLFLFAQYQYH